METSPKEQRGYTTQSASGALPNLADRPTVRLPFRPVGAPMRCPAASSPLQAAPPALSLGRRLELLGRAVFINRNFALLWWEQAISNVGDYAWDTALVLWVASFLVAGPSWAPLAVSGVVLAAALPQIMVGPFAGVFVDRWDKRQTMVALLHCRPSSRCCWYYQQHTSHCP
jgi:Transmembrane secretion effector